jgi:YVTN family beta-propeller protein
MMAAALLAQPKRDGSLLLPSGWALKPAGRQLPLDAFPMSIALSPDGKFLLALNGGAKSPSVSVISLETGGEIERVPAAGAWLGLAFTPNGRLVYVGGGSRASVDEFSFSPAGRLEPTRTFETVPEAQRTDRDFIGDVAVSPDGRLLYATSLYRDLVLILNPQSGRVIEEIKVARRPYRIMFHPDGRSFFVSSWAGGLVQQLEAENGRPLDTLRAGLHPTAMLWRDKKVQTEPGEEPEWTARLFVAAAHTNNVYVFGANQGRDFRLVETINVALTPRQPVGMAPGALALSPDQNRLYVALSSANAVAVVDVTDVRSRVIGYLPTGAYPTAVCALADRRLAVLNGKGLYSGPPAGTLSLIDPFGDEELEGYTRTVLENSPYRDELLDGVPIPAHNPVPGLPDGKSPIEHVVYILRQGRPRISGPGASLMPNLDKLAAQFVRFDNFYALGDGPVDGLHWAIAAIVPDYVEKLAGRRPREDLEGGDPLALPPTGYLWTQALARGLAVRNYGHLVRNKPKPGQDGIQIETVRDGSLRGFTNFYYRGPDPEHSDLERAGVFLRDLAQFDAANNLPRLIVMRLGAGDAAGEDYALGLIVEALSRSKFWPRTAVFFTETAAERSSAGAAWRRSLALVISPFTRRAIVDSTRYDTTSLLRTIELILGLRPMTQFDAAATPMFRAFQAEPDPRPYTAEKPRVPTAAN